MLLYSSMVELRTLRAMEVCSILNPCPRFSSLGSALDSMIISFEMQLRRSSA